MTSPRTSGVIPGFPVAVARGEVFTRTHLGHEFRYVRTQCHDCAAEIEASPSSENPLCTQCNDERQHAEQLERERKERAVATWNSVPQRYQEARLRAPQLVDRIHPPAIIEKALPEIGRHNIVLVGPSGAGKTTLGVVLMRESAERRKTIGRFATTFELAEARRQNRLGQGEASAIRRAAAAGVLLLDELGAEQGHDAAVEEVIRIRHDTGLPTIFTCGFERPAIAAKYGAGIERRIYEDAVVLRLGGSK